MIVKLLTEYLFGVSKLKRRLQRLFESLYLSKCQIVGNLKPLLILDSFSSTHGQIQKIPTGRQGPDNACFSNQHISKKTHMNLTREAIGPRGPYQYF